MQIIEGVMRYRISYRRWCRCKGGCECLDALELIPKKNGALPNDFYTEGFGLRAVIEFSAFRMLIWLILSLCLTLIYAVIYLKDHPRLEQISNAFTLWTVVGALWSVVVVLPDWRTIDPSRSQNESN